MSSDRTLSKQLMANDYEQAILDALSGKVVCSGCNQPFAGQRRHPGFWGVPGVKVMRYVAPHFGAGGALTMENLIVELQCRNCRHEGTYTFDGNPLAEAIKKETTMHQKDYKNNSSDE